MVKEKDKEEKFPEPTLIVLKDERQRIDYHYTPVSLKFDWDTWFKIANRDITNKDRELKKDIGDYIDFMIDLMQFIEFLENEIGPDYHYEKKRIRIDRLHPTVQLILEAIKLSVKILNLNHTMNRDFPLPYSKEKIYHALCIIGEAYMIAVDLPRHKEDPDAKLVIDEDYGTITQPYSHITISEKTQYDKEWILDRAEKILPHLIIYINRGSYCLQS